MKFELNCVYGTSIHDVFIVHAVAVWPVTAVLGEYGHFLCVFTWYAYCAPSCYSHTYFTVSLCSVLLWYVYICFLFQVSLNFHLCSSMDHFEMLNFYLLYIFCPYVRYASEWVVAVCIFIVKVPNEFPLYCQFNYTEDRRKTVSCTLWKLYNMLELMLLCKVK